MSLERNISKSDLSKLVKCWYQTDNIYNLSRVMVMESLSIGQNKEEPG